ncbi:MAG: adenylate/guanylate cyclase domain-containing protein [Polyangiales bacterium]
MSRPTAQRRKLERLLDTRNEHPEKLAEIDARIAASFEETVAILVLDMCGFSRLTIRHGIVHYLAMIRRMQRTVVPLVQEARGHVVKTEADNLFATFAKVADAIQCARTIQSELARANEVLPADWDVHVGIGIGYGPLLLIGEDDVFGSEMNLASKLGEDIAEAGEILLTASAHERAGSLKRGFTLQRARVGSLRFPYYRAKTRAKKRTS